jgi:hypothetical protein
MISIHDCQAGRLAYIEARITAAEEEVQQLRRLINQLLGAHRSIADIAAGLVGQIDEIHCTLGRARTVCQALLATDGEAVQ